MDKPKDSREEDELSTEAPMEVGRNLESEEVGEKHEQEHDEEHSSHLPGFHVGHEETPDHSPSAESPSRTSGTPHGEYYGMEYHHGARPPPGYHHYQYPYHQPPPPPPHYQHHRRSPPPSASSSSNAHAFPATPASNGAVRMAGRRGAPKVSPKMAPTPSATESTPGSAGTPSAATPSSKAQRGLRHFSIMVCKHVEEKGVTTYNQVADELVRQVITEREQGNKPRGKFDEKNIRRRVYDAYVYLLCSSFSYQCRRTYCAPYPIHSECSKP